ncbi:hypothetical protein LCGC14_0160930 [marine sediment metagenome]|uniref:Ribosomal RNA adenine methylase transferase N-terminal domain-containing protein n=1 Tax=marine sediment metagenome TaxID=412755 RepID=A0A0F9UVQ1_9ZZZZ
MISIKIVKNLLKKYKVRPSKRFGQNFLIDRNVLRKIITTADLRSKDVILEVGPGTGILTQGLAGKVKEVIAIEKDPKMVKILQETTKNLKNVKIIQGDILKLNTVNCRAITRSEATGSKNYKLKTTNYKLVANLPYYIVSPVIRKFLESNYPPKLMILMTQKEVAQRIIAKPPNMSLLAVSVQFYAKPEIVSYISKKSFWPQPKVDSAILKITPEKNQQRPDLCGLFFRIVRAGFSQPRKQLINNLARLRQGFGGQAKISETDRQKIENWLLKNKIRPSQRAETLSVQEWLKLTKTFNFT